MKRTREERIQEYARVSAMSDAVEKELLNIPGVAYVAVGLKVINHLPTEEICFRVYVDRKKPVAEIPDGQKIPLRVRDIKTDVNEIPRNVTACTCTDDGKYRPLAGGIKIFSAKGIEQGTLGCLVIDNENDNVALLSNYHILMINGEEKGHQIAQPDFCCDACCCRCGEIAKLERGFWADHNVDCAIATLTGDNQEKWVNEVIGLGPISSLPLDDAGKPKDPPVVGDTVFKRGINLGPTKGPTEGLIIEITKPEHPISVGYRTKDGDVTKNFKGQIVIGPKDFNKPFTRKGDSGAVIINHMNQVIGLHFADNEVRDEKNKVKTDATKSYANPIWDVISALNITIPDTGTLLSMPLRYAENRTTLPNRDILGELEKTIEQHPDGTVLIDAFKKHGKEVMQLINNDREVKVAWNRYQGPSFTAHLMEKMKDPEFKVPMTIEGVSYQRLLTKMSVVLEKNGSPEMVSDIERYSTKAFILIENLIRSFNGRVSPN